MRLGTKELINKFSFVGFHFDCSPISTSGVCVYIHPTQMCCSSVTKSKWAEPD